MSADAALAAGCTPARRLVHSRHRCRCGWPARARPARCGRGELRSWPSSRLPSRRRSPRSPSARRPTSSVQLPVFEGPLQLLLHLIESRQLDILTVPLAELADGYVTHLARHPVDAANLAEFVAIAAQLIYLKSRRLLPNEPLPVAGDDDEPSEEELRRRLLEYRALRDAARRSA